MDFFVEILTTILSEYFPSIGILRDYQANLIRTSMNHSVPFINSKRFGVVKKRE